MTMSGGGLGIAHLADIKTVGKDGSGVLYAARDLKLDRQVTVRVFDPLIDQGRRGRFIEESKVLGGLSSHPNVVTIYDAGFSAEDRPYLISELVDGEDLATTLVRRGRIPWTEAVDIILQLCAGLEQAHNSGLLHRDLRPQNVMMVAGSAKLTEFGVSTGSSAGPTAYQSADADVIEHRAPETYTGIWDERTDLYSLTSMLFELIDGQPPFHRRGDDSAEALRLRMLHEQPPGLDPELAPAQLGVFVVAGLAKDPFDRPQSAQEFAHELQLIREGRTTGRNPSVLHGTGSMPLPEPAIAAPAPPVRPEPAPLAFSSEPAVAAAAATTATTVGALAPPTNPRPADPWDDALFSLPAAETVSTVAGPGLFTGSGTAAPMPAGAATKGSIDWSLPGSDLGGSSSGTPSNTDGTAIYGSSFTDTDPPPPTITGSAGSVPPGQSAFEPELLSTRQPWNIAERSPAFLGAVAMIAIGLIGLLAVGAYSLVGGDEQEAAPLLPDGSQPIQAGDTATVGTPPATQPDALAADTNADAAATTVPPTTVQAPVEEESTTTETTIPRVEVPRVIGQAVETATETLTAAGFEVDVVSRQATAPPGVVAAQTPNPGSEVTLPSTVTLVIPRVATLPEMVGRNAVTVCQELEALNVTCSQTLQFSNDVPAGDVISATPNDGETFSEGSTVRLTVSGGPAAGVVIPDVAGQTREEAEATLNGAGFNTLAFETQASADVQENQAIGTNPAAGETLATDQTVTVLISSGPPEAVTVPDVVGQSQADAETALAEAGFEVTVATQDLPAGDENIGNVVSMDPAAESSAAPGSTVTITVGQEESAGSDSGGSDGGGSDNGGG